MKRVNRLYVARHGQVVGYDRFPVYGHTDVDLTEVGIAQMEHLADRLRLTDIKAIYSSDLKRSALGAQIIARDHDVPLYALPDLREIYFGDWEGLTFEELRKRFPGGLKRREEDLLNFQAPGDGEAINHLSRRVLACLQDILKAQAGNDILFIGHGAVNRVIICDALGLTLTKMFNLQQDYGCLNIIDYFSDSIVVRLING